MRNLALVILTQVITAAAFASWGGLRAAADGQDWPHWRGPTRDGITGEDSGFDRGVWPPKNPLWERNVGSGASSPLVVGARVYVLGWRDGRDHLACLEAATGSELWTTSYACPEYGRHATGDQGLYSGATSTPEYDPQTGYLYTLSTDGDLHGWDTNQRGRAVWRLNLYEAFDVSRRKKIGRSGQRDYGYTTSPLVHGDWLIVEVGASQGNLIAFDKRTGARRWSSASHDQAGHTGGPVPMTVAGVPCAAVLTLSHLLVVRLDRGREGTTVAEYPWETEFANNIATPAVSGDCVLVTSGYNHDALCKLKISLDGATKLWQQPYFSQVCSPTIREGRIYWVWNKPTCLDWETGSLVWQGPSRFGDAGSSILTSDGRWIFFAGRGELVLAETAGRSPREYRELARTGPIADDDVWPHAVLSHGRLYLKDRRGSLGCYALTSKSPAPATTAETPPEAAPPAPDRKTPVALTRWPGEAPGLVAAWKRGMGDRVLDASGKPSAAWRLEPRGAARIGPSGTLELSGGAILVRGVDETLFGQCRRTSELGVEIRFASHAANQTGPARVISFSSDPYSRNFTLGQEADRLLFRLRTPNTGENGMSPQTDLVSVAAHKAYHVVVSYRPGELVCYVDGKQVASTSQVQGDFRNWSPQHLLLGGEWEGDRPWLGAVERWAVYSRFIGAEEARQRSALAKTR